MNCRKKKVYRSVIKRKGGDKTRARTGEWGKNDRKEMKMILRYKEVINIKLNKTP